ncbi:MAG: fumarylacetoacetate hydrolase family protein, partial [Anaerolineae bacterium]|nr:fumarylacetoacetate hydrolase family protein [Anaerolineae bacterium]
MTTLVRFSHPEFGPRLGALEEGNVFDVTPVYGSVAAFLARTAGQVDAALAELRDAAGRVDHVYPANLFDRPPAPGQFHWLAPVDSQDVWAAGVTYERSRAARQQEAQDGGDVYARVYTAERPELFFKARGERVVGPFAPVGIRSDSPWNVPEPELALVINPALEIVGLTIGNDMSSRSIEGENPLYLPQAKMYTASCALGPGIVLGKMQGWPDATIHIRIERGGACVFEGRVHTGRIKRRAE